MPTITTKTACAPVNWESAKYTEELKNRNEIKRFIDSQLACWPLAHHNHEALQTIQTKELSINGYTFVVQCNAQRAVSTTAKVDKDSIQARPCFLCKETSLRSRKHWKPSLQTEYALTLIPYCRITSLSPIKITSPNSWMRIFSVTMTSVHSYRNIRTTPYSIMEHIAEPLHRTISIFKESEN